MNPRTPRSVWRHVLPQVVAFSVLTTLSAFAQTAPQPPSTARAGGTAPPKTEETIQLNAFEVRADSDTSYGALESNSIAAFRMDLAKAPVTAQVFTQTFMDDIAATSIEEVLTGYTGTVTASSNNPAAQLFAPGDRDGAQGLSIRGVGAGEIKRDGFIGPPNNARTASGNTDNFSVERVEVIEGPQSILYGSVGGGGVINSVSKRAQFGTTRGSLRFIVDQYGSKRAVLDYGYGRERAAIRVALLGAENANNRYKLGGELYGIYAQVAFRLLPQTTLRFSTEKTDNDARVGFKPNLNNFLSATDPRRNRDARYLVLTNQVSDLKVLNEPLTYGNLESLGSWWSGERIRTHWNSMILESQLGWGLSAQLTAIYSETLDDRITDGRNLLPARGLPNAGANPFDVTAVQIGAPVQINEQRDRNKGARLALVHEKNFSFWKLRGRSQTAFGGQGFHRGPTFGSSGMALVYFQADANGNVLYTHANGTTDTTPDYTRSEYGRTALQNVFFPVQNGIPSKPVFRPGERRVNVNGVNYVLEPRITSDASRITPANPFGLIPNNNPATGTFSGNWNRGGETHSGSVYAANFVDWFDGRLTTLAGYSLTRFETLNVGPGSSLAQPAALTPTPKEDHPGWQLGVNYRVLQWLRVYALTGTAEQAEASTTDIYGFSLKNPQAKNSAPEFGFKISTPDGGFSAQFSVNPSTKTLNENRNTGDTSFRDAINPDGINGRLNGSGANQRVNVDRTLTSQQVLITASPTRNWRMRLSGSHLDGEISSDVIYQQLYNDQFTTSGNNVTYTNGQPVLVDATGNITAAAQANTPLTLTMINTVGNPYHAQPEPTSGRIQNTTLRNVLIGATPFAAGRTSATGRTGLPISSVQYNFSSPYPNGTVVIYRSGEMNTGFNEYTLNFQNQYTFSQGVLRGLGVFFDVQTYAKNRAYYVNYPDTSGSLLGTRVARELYRLPRATVFNLGLSYRRKGLPWLGEKYQWTTQLNVRNVLNHYRVWVVPTSSNGTVLNARLSAQPRMFIWTNTLSF
jgi:outer membrane receptor protein involved in Fe transport